MKRLFNICLVLVGCASFTTALAQNTVTTKRQVCVESRNDLLPMATLGTIPANAKFVGNIAPDPTYFCESAKKVTQVTEPAAPAAAPAEKMQRPTRRRPDPKR
jgi:hypothetical protein